MLPFVTRGGASGEGARKAQTEKKSESPDKNSGNAKGRKRTDISATPARVHAVNAGGGGGNAAPVSDKVMERGKKDRGKQPKKGRTNNGQRTLEEFASTTTASVGTPAASDGAVDSV